MKQNLIFVQVWACWAFEQNLVQIYKRYYKYVPSRCVCCVFHQYMYCLGQLIAGLVYNNFGCAIVRLDETQNFINCGHKKTRTNPEVQSHGSMYREMAGVPKSIYITCPSDINILKVKIDANCSISGKIENSCLLESHESFTCRDPKINHNIQRKSLVLLEWFRQTRRISSLDF